MSRESCNDEGGGGLLLFFIESRGHKKNQYIAIAWAFVNIRLNWIELGAEQAPNAY